MALAKREQHSSYFCAVCSSALTAVHLHVCVFVAAVDRKVEVISSGTRAGSPCFGVSAQVANLAAMQCALRSSDPLGTWVGVLLGGPSKRGAI